MRVKKKFETISKLFGWTQKGRGTPPLPGGGGATTFKKSLMGNWLGPRCSVEATSQIDEAKMA